MFQVIFPIDLYVKYYLIIVVKEKRLNMNNNLKMYHRSMVCYK
jgi:hypothetical protein